MYRMMLRYISKNHTNVHTWGWKSLWLPCKGWGPSPSFGVPDWFFFPGACDTQRLGGAAALTSSSRGAGTKGRVLGVAR